MRYLNWPAPNAEGPFSGNMAAGVEVVTTIAARIRITSSGNVLLFIVLLLVEGLIIGIALL